MSEFSWLSAPDCPLLRLDTEAAPASLRLIQRLLERMVLTQGTEALARCLLEEIARVLRADYAGILEAPDWTECWRHLRSKIKPPGSALPRSLLSDVLDREAGTCRPPGRAEPAYLAACLSYTDRANRVLIVSRTREPFERSELEYGVAAGHYFGVGLEGASSLGPKRLPAETVRGPGGNQPAVRRTARNRAAAGTHCHQGHGVAAL